MSGTFALTFDTELIWGSFDTLDPAAFARRYPDVRVVIDRILRLLETYEVAATWAVVGHLFLERCARGPGGLAHEELPRPGQRWWPGDWYAADPCTSLGDDPLWYGPDILDAIQGAAVAQEIGCHSFSHVLFGDPDLSRAAADADLAACQSLAAQRGLTLRSFVFPRNSEGHHEALRAAGFSAFRGTDPTWFARLPGALSRPGHLVDQVLGVAPPVSRPRETLPGLWNVPGSALLIHRAGPRRAISPGARLRKARAGLLAAARADAVFHLWTHPFNLAANREFMLASLDDILRAAAAARDRGLIEILTMAEIADAAGGVRAAAPGGHEPASGHEPG